MTKTNISPPPSKEEILDAIEKMTFKELVSLNIRLFEILNAILQENISQEDK